MASSADSEPTNPDAPEEVQVSSTGSQTCALESLVPETFYSKVRPLAIFNKLFGTFPLTNIIKRDGRELRHSWLCLWQLYDVVLCCVVMFAFYFSTMDLLECVKNEEEKYKLTVWLSVTFYTSALRAVITFFVSHFYAHKYPELFYAMEEYQQGIGVYIIKKRTRVAYQKIGPIVASLLMLLALGGTSFMFFSQFTGTEAAKSAWPAGVSFMFMYMWKELPINMFICLLVHLIYRFDEVREKIKEVRLRNDKDSSCDLESHRLQYAALMNILNLLQKCYGLQLAVNIFFLIFETIAQMFIFIVIADSKNIYLLDLCIYNFCMAGLFIFFLDRMERKGEHVLEELSSIDLNSKSRLQQMQIQMFILQVQARPVQISASGFCVINNSLIGSLFGAIATYLIVLVQFAPYVLELTNSTLTTSAPPTIIGQNGHIYQLIR